ncbi:DUF177 domain-containing protein [Chloroflexota bacterium]
MQINVAQQLKAPIGSMRNYHMSETVDIDGNNHLVEGEIRLTRTQRSIFTKGILRTKIELTCSRCLNLFSCPLKLNIEEEYFPTIDVWGGSPLSLADESGCFTIDNNNTLDLTEAIRQYGLLAVPMKPLCDQDCAGLCSNCGHNLNEGPCNCLPQRIGPRHYELSKLYKMKGG